MRITNLTKILFNKSIKVVDVSRCFQLPTLAKGKVYITLYLILSSLLLDIIIPHFSGNVKQGRVLNKLLRLWNDGRLEHSAKKNDKFHQAK